MNLVKLFFTKFSWDTLVVAAGLTIIISAILFIIGALVYLGFTNLGWWFLIGLGIFVVLVLTMYTVFWYSDMKASGEI